MDRGRSARCDGLGRQLTDRVDIRLSNDLANDYESADHRGGRRLAEGKVGKRRRSRILDLPWSTILVGRCQPRQDH